MIQKSKAYLIFNEQGAVAAYAAVYNQRWAEALSKLPNYMQNGIASWVIFGHVPGDFLQGIISGDLYKACWHADGTNAKLLYEYAGFFYNFAPSEAYKAKALETWKGATFEPEDEVAS